MLAALAASGQTPSAFARAKGFPPYRVSYWRTKLGEGQGPATSVGQRFVPITVRDDVQEPEGMIERRVEVTLPNGRVVTFAGRWDAAAVVPWLRALDGER